MSLDVMFFEVRGRRCAVPVSAVREVAGVPSVTPVPLAPPILRGLAPLGGQALPLLDLGVWLSGGVPIDPIEASFLPTGGAKLLVIEAPLSQDGPVVRAALAVDRVSRIGTVDEQHAKPPPAGAAFVSATVLDIEGPALLVDAAAVMNQARRAIAAGRKS